MVPKMLFHTGHEQSHKLYHMYPLRLSCNTSRQTSLWSKVWALVFRPSRSEHGADGGKMDRVRKWSNFTLIVKQ